jgi:hypothetical protein
LTEEELHGFRNIYVFSNPYLLSALVDYCRYLGETAQLGEAKEILNRIKDFLNRSLGNTPKRDIEKIRDDIDEISKYLEEVSKSLKKPGKMRTGGAEVMTPQEPDEAEVKSAFEEALEVLRNRDDIRWKKLMKELPYQIRKEVMLRIWQTPEYYADLREERRERYEANKDKIQQRCTPTQIEGIHYYIEHGSEREGAAIAKMEFEEFDKLLNEIGVLIF